MLEKNLIIEKAKTPKSLVCPLTKKLLNNPICNEYGHSYSKDDYLKYLKENQNKDPISKKEVKHNIMYPNINLKKAVEHYLEKNPWAFDEQFD